MSAEFLAALRPLFDCLTDGQGRTVNLTNTAILTTSNAPKEEVKARLRSPPA